MAPGRARTLAAALAVALLALPARAPGVVIAAAPGKTVNVLEENVTLIFDPLTSSQSVLIQFEFEGTASAFGLIVPTPKPADVARVSDRVRRAFTSVMRPRAQTQRILDVEYYSWAANCAVRDLGDVVDEEEAESRVPTASAEIANLGASPDPMHDWLLHEGFTLAPAQAAWLSELRSRGWSMVGVTIRPPVTEGPPHSRLRGPVIALTHEAEEPIYAATMPPLATSLAGSTTNGGPPLEIAVLTEWAVSQDIDSPPEPFFADSLSGREVLHIANEAGGTPWNFRRDGTLTAFELERPEGLGIVHFVHTAPRPAIHPPPGHELKTHRLRVPVELMILVVSLLAWTWMRYVRHHNRPTSRVMFGA